MKDGDLKKWADQGWTSITLALRRHQEQDEVLGPFFKALHTFADRTIDEFFSDTPDLPYPVVAMEKDRVGRLGYYTERDGYALIHRINLNPYALSNGEQAAETLAHELVHLWQAHVGRPIKRDYHSAEFHQRMAEYGIETSGKKGRHIRYIDITWHNWMEENSDLELWRYSLPGKESRQTKRKLLKHQCPDCGASFRNRNELAVLCLTCSIPFEVVNLEQG
jgi:hypothetical protein